MQKPKRVNWKDYQGMGNKFRRSFHSDMLTDGGHVVLIKRKLERGSYAAYEPVEVVFDRDFVIQKLTRETILQLVASETDLIELVKESYKEIKKQHQLKLSIWENAANDTESE